MVSQERQSQTKHSGLCWAPGKEEAEPATVTSEERGAGRAVLREVCPRRRRLSWDLKGDKGAMGSSGRGWGETFLAEDTAMKLPYESG